MAFIRGTRRLDRLNGTDDSDFIFGLAGDDVMNGGDGDDTKDQPNVLISVRPCLPAWSVCISTSYTSCATPV